MSQDWSFSRHLHGDQENGEDWYQLEKQLVLGKRLHTILTTCPTNYIAWETGAKMMMMSRTIPWLDSVPLALHLNPSLSAPESRLGRLWISLFVNETITQRWERVIQRSHQWPGATILPLLEAVYLFLGLPFPEPNRNLVLSGVLHDTLHWP